MTTFNAPDSAVTNSNELHSLECDLLLEGIYRHYGADFRHYATASIRRRIDKCVADEQLRSVSALQERLLHSPKCMGRTMRSLSVSVTAMFRDPDFYRQFRQVVVPKLRTYPYLRIWVAGCATGEELYSVAILLHEEGLLKRTRLYGTDMNVESLQTARKGIYSADVIRNYTKNYFDAGGTRSLSDYYTAGYDHLKLNDELREQVLFSEHNLATDSSFNEFHVVLCRNVMIYFNEELQERVLGLLHGSLSSLGFLALGSQESLRASHHKIHYEAISKSVRLYRRNS